MNRMMQGLLVLILAIAIEACSSKGGIKEGESGATAGASDGAGGAQVGTYGEGDGTNTYGTGAGGAGSGAYGADASDATGDPRLDDPNSPLHKRVIYFSYDSSEVLPEYVSVVKAHGQFMAENQGKSAALEGHADERGSPEYNIALGEQRAKAISKMLQLQGASDGQLQIVSYGEEKPAVEGHDESAYSQNRRVEIVYRRQ